jgi:hypothetical protein
VLCVKYILVCASVLCILPSGMGYGDGFLYLSVVTLFFYGGNICIPLVGT